MDWDDPKVKRWMSLLPVGCAAIVSAAFWFDNWLFHHRPTEPGQGFTEFLIYSGGQGTYVRPWEETTFYVLLIGGVALGLITVLINRALYGKEAWTPLSRVLFGVLLLGTFLGLGIYG